MAQRIMHLFKTFVVCAEVAIVVSVIGFFVVEGFAGNTVLNVILLFLGTSSLAMLVGVFLESRKQP